jgi:hypothetical protein
MQGIALLCTRDEELCKPNCHASLRRLSEGLAAAVAMLLCNGKLQTSTDHRARPEPYAPEFLM